MDFGEFYARIAKVLIKLWMFALRLSYSGRAFHVAFTTQAREAFLEGHVRAFEHLGGVPARIRPDYVARHMIRDHVRRRAPRDRRWWRDHSWCADRGTWARLQSCRDRSFVAEIRRIGVSRVSAAVRWAMCRTAAVSVASGRGGADRSVCYSPGPPTLRPCDLRVCRFDSIRLPMASA